MADPTDALTVLSPATATSRSRVVAVAATVALGAVIVVLAALGGSGPLSAPKAIVLGAVEASPSTCPCRRPVTS